MCIYNDMSGFIEYIKKRKLLLWGTGEYCHIVTDFLNSYGIEEYSFIDKSNEKQKQGFLNKKVYSPEEALADIGNIFIIISCSYYKEISNILSNYGLNHFKDFIDGIYIENEICILKYKDVESAKALTIEEMSAIEEKLKDLGINTRPIEYYESDLKVIEKQMDFVGFYKKIPTHFIKGKCVNIC